MSAREPNFFDMFAVRARAAICILGKKLDPSLVKCQSMSKRTYMLHACDCLWEHPSPQKAD